MKEVLVTVLCLMLIAILGCRSPQSRDTLLQQHKSATGQPPLPNWSNLVEKARSQMTRSNGVNRVAYNLENPILIPGALEPTSTQPPGTLIGFPLKRQDPRLTSRGWTELGIIFWIPPEGDSNHTHYPNQIGMMYLVKVDKEGRATEKHYGGVE